jgi:hypothetical protein
LAECALSVYMKACFIYYSFDSGKFSRHDKVRLREAIDNLNSVNVGGDTDGDGSEATKTSQPKRLKTTNMPEATNGVDVALSCGVSSSGNGIA